MQVAQNTPRTDGREKITRRKLSDQVLDKLHDMIATGTLAAGDAMPSERALMDRFGVGRPAVREALQSLHNSGLITINHGERSRVNAVNASTVLTQSGDIARLVLSSAPANLDHLKQARRMFELGLVRVAAQTATADVVADLRALVERQRSCLGDATTFIEADVAFHKCIAQAAQNPIVSSVSEAMLGWLFDYHMSLLHWSGKEDITLAEHSRIVDLIEDRDEEGAVAAMARHLDRSSDAFEAKA